MEQSGNTIKFIKKTGKKLSAGVKTLLTVGFL